MNYFLCFAMTGVSFALARWTLDIKLVRKSKWIAGKEPAAEARELSAKWIWLLSAALALCGGGTMWQIMRRAADTVSVIALSVSFLCLLGSGCVDFLEHRIPNLFPAVLGCGAVVLLGWALLSGQDGAIGYAVSAGMACAVCAVGLVIASALSGGGIGAGDVKLVSALALMVGVTVICRTLFFGMTLCALTAAGLLASRKKTRKDGVPFAPFLLFGFVFGLWITFI